MHEIASAQESTQRITVADEIGLMLFGSPSGETPELHFSPDSKYFAVWTERGRLDLNQVEDSVRFYSSQDVDKFLKQSDKSQPPSPVWLINRSDKKGPIINDWRWLADSSGVAFLECTTGDNQRLMLADLRKKKIEPLTSAMETVQVFDIHDRNHYVYTTADPAERTKWKTERQAPATVGTGRSLNQLLLPNGPRTIEYFSHRTFYLWAVVGGQHFEVKKDGMRVIPDGNLTLSPDGGSLVTKMPVSEVPASWEIQYPPPYPSFFQRIHAGYSNSAHQYVLIDLHSGSVRPLTDAPVSNDAGWFVYNADPSWSSDGQEILLPGTFLKSKENAPSRPCIVVVDLPSHTQTCVETLKGHTENGGHEEGYHGIHGARFADADKQRIIVSVHNGEDFYLRGTIEYRHTADGTWQNVGQNQGNSKAGGEGLEVTVKQGFDEPPLLVASNNQTSKVIWNPNPQLKSFELGEASVYKWKDKEGRDWEGGLYKPLSYKAGQRYPLVIQTHGFDKSEFRPSGVFPTGFAARALAAAGMAVLQVEENCPVVTPDEGPCAASGYETAVQKLASEGLVDADKVGIIGFSRTCFYVMEVLTAGFPHLKAALITDGNLVGYLEYMMSEPKSGIVNEANLMIGAKPFSEGLQQWLKRSPLFKLDHVHAPLLVVGMGPSGVLQMWEPYSGLRHLNKPVDLIMLNTDEHVLTNPAVRMASQGGSVDWFRFWLKGEEDSGPAKAEQYARWHALRKLQEESDKR